jgi:hypothetical protein
MKDLDKLTKEFIKEFFPIKELFEAGFFTKEMKGNYNLMAGKICYYFGYKTVFEYRSKEIRCHISYSKKDDTLELSETGVKELPFITIIESIY